MKLLISILATLVVSRTLLEDSTDTFKDNESADISYSNGKLANTRLPRLFPGMF